MLVKKEDIFNTYSDKLIVRTKKYLIYRKMQKSYKASQISKILDIPRRTIYGWLNGRMPKPVKTLNWLKKYNLVPFFNFDMKDEVNIFILDLHAFMFGDGSLSKTYVEISGEKNDLECIKKMVKNLLPDINMNMFKTGKNCFSLFIYSASLARFLNALGCPFGNKQKQKYLLPRWLIEADVNVIKRWLEVFIGNEGCLINSKRKIARIEQYKSIEFEVNAIKFMKQIEKLIKKFGIEVTASKGNRIYKRKDGIKTRSFYLKISRDKLNLYKFLNQFKYRYATHKDRINQKTILRLKGELNEHINRINAFLFARFGVSKQYKYSNFRNLFYQLRQLIPNLNWNTFYNSYCTNCKKPRYKNKINELRNQGFLIFNKDEIIRSIEDKVDKIE